MKRLFLPVFILAILLLGACGGDNGSKLTPTVGAGSGSADISSGCWTAEQRAPAISTEGGTLVQQWQQAPAMVIDQNKTYIATIETEKYGSFQITFYPKDAPNTVNNFVCLAKSGFYDNTTFHRLVSGFVIQGGDPQGNGTGGPGYKFADEPVTKNYVRGIVAMANSGANTNGSQYFVCLQDLSGSLPKNYTIFGMVTTGMDVVDTIAALPTKAGASGEKSTPIDPVIVKTVTIAES
jgi:cyclophilin family peptidyl-prolyl cis-trans isomerase